MPGSTEQELIEAYGPVVKRVPDGSLQKIGFLHKGAMVIAIMDQQRCIEVLYVFFGRDGKPLVMNRGMQNVLQEKLCDLTGIDDWREVPDILLAAGGPGGDALVLMWYSKKHPTNAVVMQRNPGQISLVPASDDKDD